MAKRQKFLSYEEAKEFIRPFGITTMREFKKWDRPENIPSNPPKTYKDSWVSWHEFLSAQKREFISYKDAIRYIESLTPKFSTIRAYRDWSASGNRPLYIPANPDKIYHIDGFSWSEYLGIVVRTMNRQFLSYNEAKQYLITVEPRITNQSEYREWASSGNKPLNIPANPNEFYGKTGEWVSLNDYLSIITYHLPSTSDKWFLPYHEAMEYVQSITPKITMIDEFIKWASSGNRPANIPSNPSRTYRKDNSWVSWGEFLGTGKIARADRVYLPYDEVKSYVNSIGIKSYSDYRDWAITPNRPANIPSNPNRTYHKEWEGWCVFLNYQPTKWTKTTVLAFIKAIRPTLHTLSPSEQYAILIQGGLLKAAARVSDNSNLNQVMTELLTGIGAFEEKAVLESDDEQIIIDDTDELFNKFALDYSPLDEQLPSLSVQDTLDALNLLHNSPIKSDDTVIEFIINKRIGELWNHLLNTDDSTRHAEIDTLYKSIDKEDTIAGKFKYLFLEQYEGAISLKTPEGYQFNKGNGIIEPSLMQKLIVYMQLTKQRFANWSKTGAGKTLGAILASRTINANLTVIIALNNTLTGWQDEIHNAFPISNTIVKDEIILSNNPNYLLLNYETFQQPDAISKLNHLLEHNIDMIIIDEVHCAKKRDKTVESKRRKVISKLVETAFTNNPNCNLQVMSATPVVNDLTEAVSLIELLTGNKFDDLDTRPSIHNALEVHKYLAINGIRYKPSYDSMRVTTNVVEIKSNPSIAAELQTINGNILDLEQILLREKLDTITKHCKSGTVIYSIFVDKIANHLKTHLINTGFTVGMFTGQDKSGLQPFLNKEIDILIGSSTISTGVDGLQEVCDNLIIVSLPWTSSQYEQLVGRIYRQGSIFQSITITIPQVVLTCHNEEWSWDKQRLNRINFKKTLADSAVDGVIPEGNLMSESELLNQSMAALDNWIKRIEENNLHEIHREPITIPEIEESNSNRQYGDFSQMNKQFAVSYSNTTHQRLQDNPDEFFKYHALYKEARTNWNEIPYLVIANKLKDKPYLVVADFGCGEALLAKELDNQVYSFDHIAMDDTVIECDMKQTILADNFIDVAVFSLSLQGLNWKEYLLEAKRSLKPYGNLFIAEPTYSWQDDNYQELTDTILNLGFVILQKTISNCGKFVYVDAVNLN